MNEPISCLIIEDNSQYTESLKYMLKASGHMDCLGSFNSAEFFMESEAPSADVILLDLHLPNKSGIQLIPIIRKERPESQILVLTQNDDYHTTLEAIRLGVSGYLLKDSSISAIREAIVDVHEGGSVIDPQLSKIVLKVLCKDSEIEEENVLTARERQVLEFMAMGYLKKEVAEHMDISYRTVAQYTENIYKKLRVPNVTAAVATAIRTGLI